MASIPSSTPLMRQYHALKQEKPDHLLLFRLGDFFELFFDDAVTAARDLDITLTARNKEKNQPIPMCGVPAHSIDGYLGKLIAKGHKVAIADQIEDAQKTKKLVRRAITRVITPGTATDSGMLDAAQNNYLGAVAGQGERAGLAYVDVSTGEFRMTELPFVDVEAVLDQIGAREVLEPSAGPLFAEPAGKNGSRGGRPLRTELEGWIFDFHQAERTLLSHFKLHSLDGLGVKDHPAAVSAAGAVLHYLRDTQRAALEHLDIPRFYTQNDWMALDAVTVRHLELIEPLLGAERGASLLSVIDRTRTPMGKRLLRQWLLRPTLSIEEMESRLGGVEELAAGPVNRSEIENELGRVLDIERLLAKVTLGTANPRELAGLGASLAHLPSIRARLDSLASPRMREMHERLDDLVDVSARILSTLDDEPPLHFTGGGVIRAGVDPQLDELREIRQNSRVAMAQMESRERKRTGIQSLKVRFNNVFGFYIEVSKANYHLVPDDYDRKQTLLNAERFITPELKEYERKVLEAEERILEREMVRFEELRAAAAAEARRIRTTAVALAELDVLRGLAESAAENDYVRPRFNTRGEIQIEAGRHPVVERLAEEQSGERFIANDVYLNGGDHLLSIITGPNMGGKSTYLRQTALIAILAQMGSFVPAARATLPVIDRIFTRIGAADNLAMGRSTFMVEMTETAEILHTATTDSLILLDEVGRGTATFDGLAIAWAVVEHIHARCRAKTLFATHYHELTELAELLPGVSNLHVSVKEAGERVIFLRQVEAGRADRSYGIEVARLAGLPIDVIERARQVLARHEETEHSLSEELSPGARPSPAQAVFFQDPVEHDVADELRRTDLDSLRPIEALGLLEQWKQRLDPDSTREK